MTSKINVGTLKVKDTKKSNDDRGDRSDLATWVHPDADEEDPDVLERRRKVAVCWNQLGLSVSMTAKQLGVSVATISRDRTWLLHTWTCLVEADVIEIVARELSKLEAQEAELWSAWESSKEDEVVHVDERVWDKAKEDFVFVPVSITKTGRIPDVKYMDSILKCQERRSRLLGLDKAVTFEGATFSFAQFVQNAYSATTERNAKIDEGYKVIDAECEAPKIGDEIGQLDNGEFSAISCGQDDA